LVVDEGRRRHARDARSAHGAAPAAREVRWGDGDRAREAATAKDIIVLSIPPKGVAEMPPEVFAATPKAAAIMIKARSLATGGRAARNAREHRHLAGGRRPRGACARGHVD
jgi:hypothetical protein